MDQYQERFGGISRLYGPEAAERLRAAHVAVVGIGGVGSWVAESLARSGVGTLTLCDLDEVCVTNTNRQLVADSTTVGQPKIGVMAGRARTINPDIRIHERFDFLDADNVDALLNPRPDLVVDAIDALPDKVSLALWCSQHTIPLVVCGAAGGRRRAELIEVKALGETTHDPLLRRMRRELAKVVSEDSPLWSVKAVFSKEKSTLPQLPESGDQAGGRALDCRTGFGTASWVTGTMGLIAAGLAVEELGSGFASNKDGRGSD